MLSLSSTGEHTMCGCYRPHICCLDTDFVYVIIYHVSNVSRDAVVSVPSLALSGYCLCYSTTLHQRGGFSLERGRRIFLLPLTISTALPATKQCSTIAEHIHSAYRTNPMLGSGPFEVEQQQSNHHRRSQVTIEATNIKLVKSKKNEDNSAHVLLLKYFPPLKAIC